MPPKAQTPQGHRWTFTLFSGPDFANGVRAINNEGDPNPPFVWVNDVINDEAGEIRFLIVQVEECPNTKNLHLQGYVEFRDKKRLKAAKKIIGRDGVEGYDQQRNLHVELAGGTAEDNIRYCSKKEGQKAGPWMYGHPIEKGHDPKKCKTTKWTARNLLAYRTNPTQMLREGLEQDPDFLLKNAGKMAAFNAMVSAAQADPGIRDVIVTAIIGQSGVGKSRAVFDYLQKESNGDYYRLAVPKKDALWFEGYISQKILWIDEFAPGQIEWGFFLQMLEGYPNLRLPIKGSSAVANWTHIFITSNYTVRNWFPDKGDGELTPLLRRITQYIDLMGLGAQRWDQDMPKADERYPYLSDAVRYIPRSMADKLLEDAAVSISFAPAQRGQQDMEASQSPTLDVRSQAADQRLAAQRRLMEAYDEDERKQVAAMNPEAWDEFDKMANRMLTEEVAPLWGGRMAAAPMTPQRHLILSDEPVPGSHKRAKGVTFGNKKK